MIKSEDLESLCREFPENLPDWEEMMRRIKNDPGLGEGNPSEFSDYIAYFSETHVDLTLEKLAGKHPEWNILLNPIEEGSETEFFRFSYNASGRLVAWTKSQNRTITEYDNLIQINGLPVIFEVKLSHSSHVSEYLKPENYLRKILPITDFFKVKTGHVVIISRNYYYGREADSTDGSFFREFQRKGGLVIPFYTDKLPFAKEVFKKIKEYGLKNVEELMHEGKPVSPSLFV